MFTNKRYIISLVFLLIFFFIGISGFAKEKDQKKILIVNSYHIGYSWSDKVTEGIRMKLDSLDDIDYYLEYMDTKRYLSSNTFNRYYSYLNHKYETTNFDVIVALDNNAVDFYLSYRDSSLFKDKPFVFGGIPDLKPYPFEQIGAYGVVELRSLPLLFYSMDRFFPKRNTVVVYLDDTPSSQAYKEIIKRYEKEHEVPYFNIIEDIPNDSIKYHLKSLPDSVMVYLFDMNYSENTYNPFESYLSELGDSSNIPIFTSKFDNIKGVVGGEKNNGLEHGEIVAQLAIDIINQKKIPQKIIFPEPILLFNERQLKKYDVEESLLPRNSKVINKHKSFFRIYGTLFLINALVILFVLLVVLALVASNRKLNKFKSILEDARDKAQQSEAVKTALIANISHELRTPLNSIIGFTEVLINANKDEELSEYIKYVNDSSVLLENLVNELLDLSLIDSNEIKLNYSEVYLPDVMDHLVQQNSIQIDRLRKPKLGIRAAKSENEPQIIYTDKLRLNQILQNLISNAIKYSFSGTISIGYHLLTQEEVKERMPYKVDLSHDYYFMFFVKDYGIGIPEDLRSFVFERFRRIDQLYDGQHGGVGLGLSISKSIVQIMGGDMWFTSVEKKGSTFYFTIPHVNKL